MADYGQIENYLQGKLEGDELKQFEHRLQTDASFAETVQLYSNINKEIWGDEGEQLLKQRIRQLEQKHFGQDGAGRVVPINRAKWYWVAAAAAVIIAAVFIIQMLIAPGKTADQLFAALTVRDSLPAMVRGEGDTLKTAIAKTYNNQHYARALPLLERYTQAHPADAAYNFAKAACYSETGNYTAAIRELDLLSNGTSIYKYKAIAMKALIVFRQGKKEEAIRILQMIPKEAPQYEMAQELISKLRK